MLYPCSRIMRSYIAASSSGEMSSRWRFSMIEISSAVSSSMSSTSAGIVGLPGDLRGAPAALAGDELEPAVVDGPEQDRLEDAVLADGRGELLEGRLVERQARLLRVGLDAVDRAPA